MDTEKLNLKLISAIKYGATHIVKRLLDEGADAKYHNSYPLQVAARYGRTDIVEMLIPISDAKANQSEALGWAAQQGFYDIVQMLIPVSNPKDRNSQALMLAAGNGHLKVIDLLLPVSEPKAIDSLAIRWAAQQGRTLVVKKLLGICDAKARNSQAIRIATLKGHFRVVRFLIPYSDPVVVQHLRPEIEKLGVDVDEYMKTETIKERIAEPCYLEDTWEQIEKNLKWKLCPPSENWANIHSALSRWLIRAVKENNIGRVKWLLEEGADAYFDNSRALYIAAEKGYEDIVRMLIPVSDPKVNKSETLGVAVANGHENIVKMLIPVSDPKERDSDALVSAAQRGYENIVRMLIPVSDISGRESNVLYETLKWCPHQKAKKVIELLLPLTHPEIVENFKPEIEKLGINVDEYMKTDTIKESEDMTQEKLNELLVAAAKTNDSELVKRLLKEGADAKYRESWALQLATRRGYEEVVRLLIPVSDTKARQSHALSVAAEHGYVNIVKMLILVSDPKDMQSMALRLAAREGHDKIVGLLIPVSEPSRENSDALRWAIEGKHKKCVELLIPVSDPVDVQRLSTQIKTLGIDVDKYLAGGEFDYSKIPAEKDTNLNIQLVLASLTDNIEKIKELLLKGADAKYNESRALEIAARFGYVDIVELLIPVSDPKADNSRALQTAAYNGYDKCVELLIPVSEPKISYSAPLRWAVINKHKTCVELLIPVSDPADVQRLSTQIKTLGIDVNKYLKNKDTVLEKFINECQPYRILEQCLRK